MYKEDLKLLRGALGMTQGELAEKLKYSAAYIRDMELGRHEIGLAVHKRLAQLVQGDTYRENMTKLEQLKQELDRYLED